MERDGGVLEPLDLDVGAKEPSQRTHRHRVIAHAKQAEARGQRIGGEDLAPAQPPPDPLQLASRLHGRPARGDEGGVDGPDRRADQQIGADAPLIQRLKHPGLEAPRLAPPDRTKAVGMKRCSSLRPAFPRHSRTPRHTPSICDLRSTARAACDCAELVGESSQPMPVAGVSRPEPRCAALPGFGDRS